MESDEYDNNILWDRNCDDPYFDLEVIGIPKHNFSADTPSNIINGDLINRDLIF